MDTLDNELNVQEETKQMQKMQMYQKLVFFTLFKFKWSIIAVFLATVLGVAVTAYLMTVSERSYFVIALPLLAFGAAYLWTRDLSLSLLALTFLPAAVLLNVATRMEKSRTTAICFAIAGLLISVAAIALTGVYLTQGSLNAETIRAAIEAGREFFVHELIAARDLLLNATTDAAMDEQMKEAYDQLAQSMSDDVLRATVAQLFNVIPALAAMLCSILAFLSQMLLNATYSRTGLSEMLTPSATTFTMSGTAALLYVLSFILSLLVSSSTMAGAVIQNVTLILTPGFIVIGVYDLLQATSRMRGNGKILFVLLIGGMLCLCAGGSLFYVLAMWGASGTVMRLLRQKLMEKMQNSSGQNDGGEN